MFNKKTNKLRVLVVDDVTDYVEMVKGRLECFGYKVETATNGQEGLEKATSMIPDLILLDVNMPLMNGHEMLEHIRMNQSLDNTSVIMVTNLSEAHDIATASVHGISDYIVKPFNIVELIDKVRFALESKVLN
ncbi:MAG: response regulator transcription factor [Anaerohalosphaera sp.]|nr:response regulator transcription factor [Anaerohalosphaera sp.]